MQPPDFSRFLMNEFLDLLKKKNLIIEISGRENIIGLFKNKEEIENYK